MARPPINTGSSALQAYMQGVANMGQVRAQMQQNTTNAINALGDTFTKWQDDFNKRKFQKWQQQMEEAKLAETKRVNDANIEIAYNKDARDAEKHPLDMAAKQADTDKKKADTWGVNLDNQFKSKLQKQADKMGLYNDPKLVKKQFGIDDTSTAAPNSNGVGTTGNATQLNAGGVPLGQSGNSNSAMGVVNGAKKPTATNTSGYANGYGANNYFKAINKQG